MIWVDAWRGDLDLVCASDSSNGLGVGNPGDYDVVLVGSRLSRWEERGGRELSLLQATLMLVKAFLDPISKQEALKVVCQ